MAQNLSEHRHISFTAHYTGYIWYSMGISHPVFATGKGKFLAKILHPLESWAEKHVGGSMRTTLKQRHSIIDRQLTDLIQQRPDVQILEIASGLSPRSWNFRQKFPNIHYRELDLPEMAKIKTRALQQLDAQAPEVLTADIFTQDFEKIFLGFDTSRPLAIISEGLINYFDKSMLNKLLQGITEYGQDFTELHYLTDIYPEPVFGVFLTQLGRCICLFIEIGAHCGGYGRLAVGLVGVFRGNGFADAPAEIEQGGVFTGIAGFECLSHQ